MKSLKLLSLNIWGGRRFDEFITFVKDNSSEIDIFCFQEILDTPTDTKVTNDQRANIYQELGSVLPDFWSSFAPAQEGYDFEKNVDFPLELGLAIFVRKSIKVKESGDFFVYKTRNDHKLENLWKDSYPKNVQYINLEFNGKEYWVGHLHGLWWPDDLDTEDRIKQSEKINEFFASKSGEKILAGDLNLLPESRSLKIIESKMRNLVKEFDIKSTRTILYKKENKFADYVLVSSGVEVKSFEVPDIPVSDHCPLILEFS